MLDGSNIRIRPFQYADAGDFLQAANESVATVGQWLPWCHSAFSMRDAEAWMLECQKNFESQVSYDLGIFSTETEKLLGGISINNINRRYNFGNIGYWIRQTEQGKGIATEAVQRIILYGFDQLKLSRLEIAVIEANRASRRVAEKVGATYEGVARNRLVKNGAPCAAAMYSLIPSINV